jgi:uncharacterized protein (UPF0261 family)
MTTGRIYAAGTCDTKGAELAYVRELINQRGIAAVLVDLSLRPHDWPADVPAATVAACHPEGAAAVFTICCRARMLRASSVSADRAARR